MANDECRYKYLVLGRDKSYFFKNNFDSTKKFSETDTIKILELLIDNKFDMFGGHFFQQTITIPMGTDNLALLATDNLALLADLFLYLYEADFLQGL